MDDDPLIHSLTDDVSDLLKLTLAPLKMKTNKLDKSAPRFNSSTRELKQRLRRLERTWRSNKTAVSYLAWQDSFRAYKKALCRTRTSYYPSLIDEEKNNPQFLFNTVAKLTRNHNCIEPVIPISLSSDHLAGQGRGPPTRESGSARSGGGLRNLILLPRSSPSQKTLSHP